MKVRVSALITYDTDITLEFYSQVDDGPTLEADIVGHERRLIENGDQCWAEALIESGTLHDIKIEPIAPQTDDRTHDSPPTASA